MSSHCSPQPDGYGISHVIGAEKAFQRTAGADPLRLDSPGNPILSQAPVYNLIARRDILPGIIMLKMHSATLGCLTSKSYTLNFICLRSSP